MLKGGHRCQRYPKIFPTPPIRRYVAAPLSAAKCARLALTLLASCTAPGRGRQHANSFRGDSPWVTSLSSARSDGAYFPRPSEDRPGTRILTPSHHTGVLFFDVSHTPSHHHPHQRNRMPILGGSMAHTRRGSTAAVRTQRVSTLWTYGVAAARAALGLSPTNKIPSCCRRASSSLSL